jgi:hypothetical protein
VQFLAGFISVLAQFSPFAYGSIILCSIHILAHFTTHTFTPHDAKTRPHPHPRRRG